MEGQFKQLLQEQVSGFVASHTYRMDTDPNNYSIVAVFESREAYLANGQSPEIEGLR